MKKAVYIFLWIFFILHADRLAAQAYHPVDNLSAVKVAIRNSGMEIEGKLTGLEGEIRFDSLNLKTSSFSVSVDANTISTGIDVRDENLRTDEYLDTKQYPRVSFVSKSITLVKPGTYTVRGTLTLKGISKEITIPFTAVPKNDGILFSGECRINRLDHKIGVGSIVLSNSMTISLAVFAKKM